MSKKLAEDVIFIINPNSGRKGVKNVLDMISAFQDEIAYVMTSDNEDFNTKIEELLPKYKVFVAVGGDGTVNELMKHLYGRKDKILAIYPNGSGNGFANELGFTKDIHLLIKNILRGETTDIDTLELNGLKFINNAGIGIDAAVAHRFHSNKKRGFINYVKAAARTWFRFEPIKAQIKTENEQITGEFILVSFANTRQFGNNAIVSPSSSAADGKYEIVLVKPLPIYKLPTILYRFFKGNLKNSKYIRFIECFGATEVNSSSNIFHIDGEPRHSMGRYLIRINEKSLRIISTKP